MRKALYGLWLAHVCLSITIISAPSLSFAQNLPWPPKGYKEVSYETDWIGGSAREIQCAGFAAKNYPGKAYRIIDSWEKTSWENEILRIGARYKYGCKFIVKL